MASQIVSVVAVASRSNAFELHYSPKYWPKFWPKTINLAVRDRPHRRACKAKEQTTAARSQVPDRPERRATRNMSNSMLQNAWLETASAALGGGSARRPGFGRYGARDHLVKHHNYRGEAVFLASRRWHAAKAQSHAARMRLSRAMAEADEAEQQELQALRSMGIGRRGMSSFASSQRGASLAPPMKPGGYREALAQRVADFEAELAESKAKKPSKIPSRSKTDRPPPKETSKSPANDARRAFRDKAMAAAGGDPTGNPAPVVAPAVKAPRRGGKAATART